MEVVDVYVYPRGPYTAGYLIHRACAVMLIVYAVARLCSRFDVCSRSLYYASYLFFYGGVVQLEPRLNPG